MRRRAAAGGWASGQQLPAMAGLASHYQASRGTVATVARRAAVDGLARTVRAGRVFHTEGHGLRVPGAAVCGSDRADALPA